MEAAVEGQGLRGTFLLYCSINYFNGIHNLHNASIRCSIVQCGLTGCLVAIARIAHSSNSILTRALADQELTFKLLGGGLVISWPASYLPNRSRVRINRPPAILSTMNRGCENGAISGLSPITKVLTTCFDMHCDRRTVLTASGRADSSQSVLGTSLNSVLTAS